ncbi:MAG: hypothetical protein AAB683_01330 [Patescibacteria group bacterium]
MAYHVDCRFCGKTAMNHDHDDCASRFGDQAYKIVRALIESNQDKMLSDFLEKKRNSKKWQYYLDYLRRKGKSLEVESHMHKIASLAEKEIVRILARKTSKKAINKHNKPHGHYNFILTIEKIKVNVRIEAT